MEKENKNEKICGGLSYFKDESIESNGCCEQHNISRLKLKTEWYEMIERGDKITEYLEIKLYQKKQL